MYLHFIANIWTSFVYYNHVVSNIPLVRPGGPDRFLAFETYLCCFRLSRTLVLGPVGKGWDYVATPNSMSR